MMSLEETISPITLPYLGILVIQNVLEKLKNFLKSIEIPASFRCNLLLFKCL